MRSPPACMQHWVPDARRDSLRARACPGPQAAAARNLNGVCMHTIPHLESPERRWQNKIQPREGGRWRGTAPPPICGLMAPVRTHLWRCHRWVGRWAAVAGPRHSRFARDDMEVPMRHSRAPRAHAEHPALPLHSCRVRRHAVWAQRDTHCLCSRAPRLLDPARPWCAKAPICVPSEVERLGCSPAHSTTDKRHSALESAPDPLLLVRRAPPSVLDGHACAARWRLGA